MLPNVRTKKQFDVAGGIGSILTGLFCAFIGWTDLKEGHAWHIWALMTLILVVNGFLMLRYASRVQPGMPSNSPLRDTKVGKIAKQHT